MITTLFKNKNLFALSTLQSDINEFYSTCPDEEKYIPKLCPLLQSLWDKYTAPAGGNHYFVIEQKCEGIGVNRIEVNIELPKYYRENEIGKIMIAVASMERNVNNLIAKTEFDSNKKYKIVFYGVDETHIPTSGNAISTFLRTPRLGFPLHLEIINKLTGTEYSFSCQPELREV